MRAFAHCVVLNASRSAQNATIKFVYYNMNQVFPDQSGNNKQRMNVLSAEEPSKESANASSSYSIHEFKEKVEKLKVLKETGMISDDEFEAKRKELLSSI